MTTEAKGKNFDCVRAMRQIRDRISAEIAGKSHDEISRWLDARPYSDPVLRRLAGRQDDGETATPGGNA